MSCEEAKLLFPLLPEKSMMIDIDDSGPLNPFPVNCVFQGEFHDSLKINLLSVTLFK